MENYIHAFFTTPVFRAERYLLALFASSPSTNQDVRALAEGTGDTMATWQVESRNEHQLIMAVDKAPIRTWLMVAHDENNPEQTRLYFGSAVLPTNKDRFGQPKMGWLFQALLGFHRQYSRILLWSAKRQLSRN